MTDRDEKGDEMTDRMSRRFEADSESDKSDLGSKGSQTSKTEKASQASSSSESTKPSSTAQTSNASKTEDSSKTAQTGEGSNISDRPSVLMYLPQELRDDLDLRFDELNLEYKREHGEPLEKNRDYYPAVVEAALNEDRTLEEILLESDESNP